MRSLFGPSRNKTLFVRILTSTQAHPSTPKHILETLDGLSTNDREVRIATRAGRDATIGARRLDAIDVCSTARRPATPILMHSYGESCPETWSRQRAVKRCFKRRQTKFQQEIRQFSPRIHHIDMVFPQFYRRARDKPTPCMSDASSARIIVAEGAPTSTVETRNRPCASRLQSKQYVP